MRGKNIVWISTLLLIATFAIGIVNVPKAFAYQPPPYTVRVINPDSGDELFGPYGLGQVFNVEMRLDYGYGIRSAEFKLNWNPDMLTLAGEPIRGPFFGPNAFMATLPGGIGENILVGIGLQARDWRDTDDPSVIVSVPLVVVGGGDTELVVTEARLLDVDQHEIESAWTGGYVMSNYPTVVATWWCPTRQSDGETIEWVEGGTLFYGDLVEFDASQSFSPSPIVSYHWIFQEGGEDTFKGLNTRYDFYDAVFDWILPWRSQIYGWILGWIKMTLIVENADGYKTTIVAWIRAFRLVPARTVQLECGPSHHHRSEHGNLHRLSGKVQNRGWAADMTFEYYISLADLNRIVHPNMWARVHFWVKNRATGETVAEMDSEPAFLLPQETSEDLKAGPWDISTVPDGRYAVYARGQFDNGGYAFATLARGIITKTVTIGP